MDIMSAVASRHRVDWSAKRAGRAQTLRKCMHSQSAMIVLPAGSTYCWPPSLAAAVVATRDHVPPPPPVVRAGRANVGPAESSLIQRGGRARGPCSRVAVSLAPAHTSLRICRPPARIAGGGGVRAVGRSVAFLFIRSAMCA